MAKRRSITGIRRRPRIPKATLNVTLLNEKPTSPNIQPERVHGAIAPALLPSHESQRSGRRPVFGAPETEDQELTNDHLRRRFPRLKPQVKHISQNVVHSKWKTVPGSTEEKIKEIFRLIELPIISQQSGESRQIKTQQFLASTVGTLAKRLPRIPFPPRTKELHFDYEGLLRENRILEQKLNRTIHSIGLLKDQIESENLVRESNGVDHSFTKKVFQDEGMKQIQGDDGSNSSTLFQSQQNGSTCDRPEQISLLPPTRTISRKTDRTQA